MRAKRYKWWCCPFGSEPLRLTATVSPFCAASGAQLPPEAVSLRLVDTVPAVAHMAPKEKPRRWPDVLRDLPPDGFSVPAGENRVLWLTVRVPASASPDDYTGTVDVKSADGASVSLPLQLTVHKLALPNPADWTFRVDFWQAFGRLAKAYGVAEWSEEWWGVVRTFLQDLAAHGESVVQVGRGHFDWRRSASGAWSFGFERFDRYVELCASVGIDGLIEYLQMFDGRAESSVSYADPNGKILTIKANPGEPAFDDAWLAFARALAEHCRQKGWLSRLYICPTDEPQDVYGQPTLDRFKRARQLLRDADSDLRATCALDSLRSARMLAGDIDRFVFKLREDVYDPKLAQELREQGKLVEAYICCHPDRPNSFITSEAIEPRAIGWICWQEQFAGLLRWSYINWPPDVWNKPEGDGAYAPGDLFIVYPGGQGGVPPQAAGTPHPLASTRWERLRDGFEDWEMLRAAQETIQKSRNPRRVVAQQAYDEAIAGIAGPKGKLTEYTTAPAELAELRGKLLAALDEL